MRLRNASIAPNAAGRYSNVTSLTKINSLAWGSTNLCIMVDRERSRTFFDRWRPIAPANSAARPSSNPRQRQPVVRQQNPAQDRADSGPVEFADQDPHAGSHDHAHNHDHHDHAGHDHAHDHAGHDHSHDHGNLLFVQEYSVYSTV